MKSVLIFLAGLITGVIILAGGGYIAMQHITSITDECQVEWQPVFEEQQFQSAAELAAAKTEYGRWVALGDVGLWNVNAGALNKAEQFANEALRIAQNYQSDWNYGNAIHKAHLTLGMVKLCNGDIEGAKEELILSGKTPGSPQLNSFGPNMILARELLEKGEKEIVIEYFDLCGVFWKGGRSKGKLKIWKDKVNDGVMPGFGANLIY